MSSDTEYLEALAKINLNELNGPLFMGVILNWMLLGALIIQSYDYLEHSWDRDDWGTKGVVVFILAADLAQTGATTDYTWRILVSGWGNIPILEQVPRSGIALTCVNPVISGTVQLFFAWRLWRLNTNRWLRWFPILIMLIALMQAAAAFALTIKFLQNFELSQLHLNPFLTNSTKVWLAGNFVADILITVGMTVLLQTAKSRAHARRTETILTRLTILAINTGSITAIAAGLDLLFFLIYPRGNHYQTLAFILGKLYSNVLLANLNARSTLRSQESDVNTISGLSGSVSAAPTNIRLGQLTSRNKRAPNAMDHDNNMEVHVHTEVMNVADAESVDDYGKQKQMSL